MNNEKFLKEVFGDMDPDKHRKEVLAEAQAFADKVWSGKEDLIAKFLKEWEEEQKKANKPKEDLWTAYAKRDPDARKKVDEIIKKYPKDTTGDNELEDNESGAKISPIPQEKTLIISEKNLKAMGRAREKNNKIISDRQTERDNEKFNLTPR